MARFVRTLTCDVPPAASGDAVRDDFTNISRVFLPRLQHLANVTDEQVSTMLEDNPQRVLAFAVSGERHEVDRPCD